MSEIRDLATFFDRHGTINLTTQNSGSVKLRISIVKASPATLKKFKDYFGVGTVGGYPQVPPHRYYAYFAYSDNARKVLAELAPYLRAKRGRAEAALEDTTPNPKDTTVAV